MDWRFVPKIPFVGTAQLLQHPCSICKNRWPCQRRRARRTMDGLPRRTWPGSACADTGLNHCHPRCDALYIPVNSVRSTLQLSSRPLALPLPCVCPLVSPKAKQASAMLSCPISLKYISTTIYQAHQSFVEKGYYYCLRQSDLEHLLQRITLYFNPDDDNINIWIIHLCHYEK